jgi:hypothetical protein
MGWGRSPSCNYVDKREQSTRISKLVLSINAATLQNHGWLEIVTVFIKQCLNWTGSHNISDTGTDF